MRLLAPVLLGLLLLCAPLGVGGAHAEDEVSAELHRSLRGLRSLPTKKKRADAAKVLAKRPGLTTERVIDAIWTLPPPEDVGRGSRTVAASVEIEGAVREVTIHLHVPRSYDPEAPAPLLMVFHGTGGSGRSDVRSWLDVSEALGMVVVAPDDVGENTGYRFSSDERDAALGALRWARLTFNIDADRVHATGVSRGGHLTWDLALRHPDLFASIAPMIGGPRLSFGKGQNNTRYIANAVRLPIRDLQGARDDPRLLANLRFVFERLEALGAADAELIEFPDLGHSFDYGAVDWRAFFGSARRPAWPERAVRAGARKSETRGFFVDILRFGKGISPGSRPLIDAKKWAALDEDAQRREVLRQMEKATAVLDVRRTGPRSYVARGSGVKSWRLLLPTEEVGEGAAVVIEWNGRTVKRRPKASLEVLLADWVERLDPGFLPVAEIRL